jgi:protoheme IX farnesyltransferase
MRRRNLILNLEERRSIPKGTMLMMSTALGAKSIETRRARSWKEWGPIFLCLVKIRTSLLAALTTATGYLLATEDVTVQILISTSAVFLLACGACALNQYQERKIDGFMERTRNRPLPSGKLSPSSALFISVCLISAGSFTLFRGASFLAGVLGVFAVFWYNGIYTPLKRKTAFAAIPGGLIGGIPPVLGWVSGGGSPFDHRIGAIFFFFFMWQVPHFWLLLLDFRRDYERSGLPSVARVFSASQLGRITFMWILATAVSSMIIPFFGIVDFPFTHAGLLALSSWLVWRSLRLLTFYDAGPVRPLPFNAINSYALFVILLLSLDHLF